MPPCARLHPDSKLHCRGTAPTGPESDQTSWHPWAAGGWCPATRQHGHPVQEGRWRGRCCICLRGPWVRGLPQITELVRPKGTVDDAWEALPEGPPQAGRARERTPSSHRPPPWEPRVAEARSGLCGSSLTQALVLSGFLFVQPLCSPSYVPGLELDTAPTFPSLSLAAACSGGTVTPIYRRGEPSRGVK